MKNLIEPEWDHNRAKLKKFFHVVVSQELMSLAEPCYAPKIKKYENTLYNFLNISKSDLQIEIKKFYKGTAAEKWLLENDSNTNLLILIMHYFLTKRDMVGFRTAMLFYNIRQYSNLFHRNFTFCQPDVFKFTLENISKSHIYSREKTVANAVYHFSNQMTNRWTKTLTAFDSPKQISKFVRECRHRHAQSIKSFTISYYKNTESDNARIKQTKEEITNSEGETSAVESSQKTPQKIIDLVEKISLYRYVDINALETSLRLNNVNKIYGQLIVKEIGKPENHDNLIAIYKMYITNLKNVSDICSSKFIGEIKKIFRSKDTKARFFKESCSELLVKCIYEAKLKDKYKNLSIQSKYMYLNFLIFYLCWSLKNYICKK